MNMNKKVINTALKKYKLEQRVMYLEEYKSNLKHSLQQIEKAKVYKLWKKYTTIREQGIIFIKKFVRKIKTSVKNSIPYSLRQQAKKQIAQLNTDKKEFESFKKALDKSVISDDKQAMINARVSVIIPTRNAGPLFDTVLKKIILQKNIPTPEIIIIDSESTDETVPLAKEHGAKIIHVKTSDFSHSKTRNIAAAQATGDYIIFTVQDAYCMNEYTIYELINLLTNASAVAGSARQIPRADADVFACWQIDEFVSMITPKKQNIAISLDQKKFEALNIGEKRAQCTIDDVFSIYKTDIFNKLHGYNENYAYGEDLEMGKRLIEAGETIAFLYTNGVIHSHTRPASYILKRYYTDTAFLFKVFNKTDVDNPFLNKQIEHIIASLSAFAKKIELASQDISDIEDVIPLINDSYKETIESNFTSVNLLDQLQQQYKTKGIVDHEILKKCTEEFIYMIKHANNYMKSYYNYESDSNNELIELMDKLFAVYASNKLAMYYLSQEQEMNEALNTLNTFLESNI